jgi:hypothetical protein
MRRLALISIALMTLTGCAPEETYTGDTAYLVTGECAGVEVAVNYGGLAKRSSYCVEVSEPTAASEVLRLASIEVEGTATYPDQIVCRVNGLPSETEAIDIPGAEPHLETCENMPPEFAYWALWVRDDAKEWEYASEGIGTLVLEPGSSIGLAFSRAGKVLLPN